MGELTSRDSGVFARALGVWCVIALAETVHGVLRGLFVTPVVGDLRARQIGVFVGAAIILLIARLFRRWTGAVTTRQQLAVGAGWVALMLLFEIGLGRLLGFSWNRILSDYDPSQGGLMLVGMGVLLLAPVLVARGRAR